MKQLITLGIILLAVKTQAQIVTDRPDQTEASSTIPKGSLQIESGALIMNQSGGFIKTINAPSTLFRYGLIKMLELRAVIQYESIQFNSSNTVSGLSDVEIGVKVQLLKKEEVNTEIAFLSHLIIPTASREITLDRYGSINKLSISHAISDKIGVGYNVGYNYLGRGKGSPTYSLAIGFLLTKKIGLYIEPYGEFEEFDNHIANFDGGLTYLLKDNLQLDISAGVGLNNNMNYFSIGFSWNIAKKE